LTTNQRMEKTALKTGVLRKPSKKWPKSEDAPPKKSQRGHATDGDHVGVLGHEEHGELHGAVLGVVTGDELSLRLGQVEGERFVSA